ncbi:hypothetical protein MtrunA17_Chr1g0211471 [Medicago truncatula]|uniref:Uncharacterized protein n=1 Tax=Medicago truncatula TaxID=3880 RepID=A0A072W2E8_MEDTR|nr:hypothetical protein MTR_1g113050 [Medicago truncatula]RHN82590.1 hypothetical protein MtrunA17_Chr1g0211471 [Medicago truncatula]
MQHLLHAVMLPALFNYNLHQEYSSTCDQILGFVTVSDMDNVTPILRAPPRYSTEPCVATALGDTVACASLGNNQNLSLGGATNFKSRPK